MDNIEKFSSLEMGQINNAIKRIVKKTIESYTNNQLETSANINNSSIEALRNKLFIKFTMIDYELIFRNLMKDEKFTDGLVRYE